ncbi:MAG: hypothetical protein WCP93_00945 [Candidatus Berkelbacteria bacterium]
MPYEAFVCPECGTKIPEGRLRICDECGLNLSAVKKFEKKTFYEQNEICPKCKVAGNYSLSDLLKTSEICSRGVTHDRYSWEEYRIACCKECGCKWKYTSCNEHRDVRTMDEK